jgi:hypothetical protein
MCNSKRAERKKKKKELDASTVTAFLTAKKNFSSQIVVGASHTHLFYWVTQHLKSSNPAMCGCAIMKPVLENTPLWQSRHQPASGLNSGAVILLVRLFLL